MISLRQVGMYLFVINFAYFTNALLDLEPSVIGSLLGMIFGLIAAIFGKDRQ